MGGIKYHGLYVSSVVAEGTESSQTHVRSDIVRQWMSIRELCDITFDMIKMKEKVVRFFL